MSGIRENSGFGWGKENISLLAKPRMARGSEQRKGLSFDYRQLLTDNGFIGSMSRKGECLDNAVAESFFGTIKTEWVDDQDYRTRQEAKKACLNTSRCFTTGSAGILIWAIQAPWNMRSNVPLIKSVRYFGGSSEKLENENSSVCRYRRLIQRVKVPPKELSVCLCSTGKQRLSNQGL